MVKTKRVVVLEINSLALRMLKLMRLIFWSKSAYLNRKGVMGMMIVQIRVTRNPVHQVTKYFAYIKCESKCTDRIFKISIIMI